MHIGVINDIIYYEVLQYVNFEWKTGVLGVEIDVTPDGEIAEEFWTLDEASRRMTTDFPPTLVH